MKIYLVGGAVRDQLLNRPVKERDWVVVGATPEELLAKGFKAVGKDFPVFLHPDSKEEYALARTERKTGRGYKGFSVHFDSNVTLEDDLKRRDLTINAIAQAEDGTLVDPYHGQEDLKNKILRHVSQAFIEDPVRVLRVARFYARFAPLGFKVAVETMQLMRQMVANQELDFLVPERIWQETEKALREPAPELYFELLRECGALKIVFPEIDNLFGVPAKPESHPEIDTGVHTMMVLKQAATLSLDPEIRFAALTHDLGKAATPQHEWPSHQDHEERGIKLLQQLAKRIRLPNDYLQLAKIVMRFHGDCHKIREMSPEIIVKKIMQLDALRKPERFEKFLICCEADSKGRLGFENTAYPQAAFLRGCVQAIKQTAIDAVTQQNLPPEEIAKAIFALRVASVEKFIIGYMS